MMQTRAQIVTCACGIWHLDVRELRARIEFGPEGGDQHINSPTPALAKVLRSNV